MSFQSKFRSFHQTINLGRFSESATLREKRDRVLTRLRNGCQEGFDWFNQGSYEMGTGIKPTSTDYDIDVGVVFNVDDVGRHSPLSIKKLVYDAVGSHTQDVRWKEPCITVQYQQKGEPAFHVDLAVYAQDRYGRLHLARGKEHSGAAYFSWQACDPKGLTSTLGNRWSGEDAAQFRRVVQYLKRWKDVHFPTTGNAAPVGVGLTVLAHLRFSPQRAGWSGPHDDLAALRAVVSSIASGFTQTWSSNGWVYRISAQVPVQPFDDVFARMTDQQMTEFKGRVDTLRGWLDEAARTGSPATLVRAFGSDFPS